MGLTEDNDIARHALSAMYEELGSGRKLSNVEAIARLLDRDIEESLKARIAGMLAHHFFNAGVFERSAKYGIIACEADPTDLAAQKGLIATLNRLGRWTETRDHLRRLLRDHADDFDLHSSLGAVLGHLGQLDEARAHGTLALALKDAAARATPRDLSDVPVPNFDPNNRKKNIIAFSLFGTSDRYCAGAIKNVQAARFIYPGWTCRFYVDEDVSPAIRGDLIKEGAEVKLVGGLPCERYGTLWRFLVADDPSVDRYLIRDCDSVLNVRERVAVDEWLATACHFHVMRDIYAHSELVLAGLWGGVRGALPPMAEAIVAYVERFVYHRTLDQCFLREEMWPTIRQSVLVHDSQFAFGDRRDFPPVGRMLPGHHVGQIELP
jgi:hypothetical protein